MGIWSGGCASDVCVVYATGILDGCNRTRSGPKNIAMFYDWFRPRCLLNRVTSEVISVAAFTHIFAPNGWFVETDYLSWMQGVRIITRPSSSANAFIVISMRSKEVTQQIANRSASGEWKRVLVPLYAWNSAPINRTDIIRSFAAKERAFPFPIDIQLEPTVPRLRTST